MMIRTLLALCLFTAPAWAEASTWQIDTLHSGAHFSVRHMMVSTVRGQFGGIKGHVRLDEVDPTKSSVEATIDASTLNSGEPKRDSDLRGEEFFHIEKHPTMTFRSKRVERAGEDRLRVIGDFTLRGVTREVVLDVEGPTPPIPDKGGLRRGVSATTRLNRRDFGIIWNRVIETGGVAVSNEVTITLDVELVKR
jgi:polyisoprenoid-binding protein YceI